MGLKRTKEFRKDAVRIAMTSGLTRKQVADDLGHDVRLIPPAYVKPYLRCQKNDTAEAAAICEAVTRPSMRFVPVKSKEQQATLMLHGARELLVSQRTALINALRGHFAEFGIVVAQGARNARLLVAIIHDESDLNLSASARKGSPAVRLSTD